MTTPLVRLDAGVNQRGGVARAAREHAVLFRCLDADTVLVAASLAGLLEGPLGVWLVVGEPYPAQLAARDVATLATLVRLEHVVIETPSRPGAHAEVVRALLTNDEVNFTNDVAKLVGAFNRPAPPAPITVWSYDATRLLSGRDVLVRGRVETNEVGRFSYFA